MREITLNGAPVGLDAFDGDRIALDGLAASNVLRVGADCAYSRSGEGLHRFTDPADERVYLYSDLETFDAHRVYACFDQPDMKATYELTVTAPADWLVVSNMAPESSIADGEAPRWHFPPTPVMPTYITAIAAGPYHVVRDEHDGIPLGVYCRQSLAGYLDPDEILEVTRQGFDFLPQFVRHKISVREIRPALRARIQRRRDGECGLRHLPGVLHFPVAGHRFRPGSARGNHPARDGAHVVRQPGHDALVGRPLAERVLRHLGGHARAGRGDPVDVGVDHVRAAVQGLGLPAGSAALHPPDRGRHHAIFTRSR